jgi:hypothetical protein
VFGAETIGTFVATYHFSTCISSVVSGFIEPRIGRYSLFIFGKCDVNVLLNKCLNL